MDSTTLIWLTLAIPTLGAVGIWLADRFPNLREAVTLVTAVLLWGTVCHLLARVLRGERPGTEPIEIFGGIELALAIEPLGMLFATVASTLWIVNSIYSIGYMRGNNEPRQTPFYVCFAVALMSAMGVAFSENLFTLFLFYEILTLSTYPLVAHKGNEDARRNAGIYLVLLLVTSMGFLLPAIIWTAVASGTTSFADGGILASAGLSAGAATALMALYVFGIGKAAIMPVHFWLPAAMVAPTPVSALLHAVAVVKAGVFAVVKVVVYIFGLDYLQETGASQWAVYLAGFTVIAASLIALTHDNLKKRLAFSTVSQLSYVIMAAMVATPAAIIGATLHIAAHAVSKITLFFAAGSIYTAGHLTMISQLDGIGRRMPFTMGAFAIGALAMIGVPPTVTFLSKWFMLQGNVTADQWYALGVIALSTVLNTLYFLPIVYRAFWRAPPEPSAEHPAHGEGPLPSVIALSITGAGAIALFLYPDIVYRLAEAVAAAAGGTP
ncbi:MAG: monovalent cation/H+ antiporter subunit D family protein [Pseudomonadota bacterium]